MLPTTAQARAAVIRGRRFALVVFIVVIGMLGFKVTQWLWGAVDVKRDDVVVLGLIAAVSLVLFYASGMTLRAFLSEDPERDA